MASEPEMMAQSKLFMECKVAMKRVQDSLSRLTGDSSDKVMDEVVSMLPLRTVEGLRELEEKLESCDFIQAMTSYIQNLKGLSEDVASVIRPLFTDDLIEKYNWDGRYGKHPLASLILVNKVMRDAFQSQSALDFEKGFKKAVECAHHRVKQKNYLKSRK